MGLDIVLLVWYWGWGCSQGLSSRIEKVLCEGPDVLPPGPWADEQPRGRPRPPQGDSPPREFRPSGNITFQGEQPTSQPLTKGQRFSYSRFKSSFVSSTFLKCRLLKWLLAHPMKDGSQLRSASPETLAAARSVRGILRSQLPASVKKTTPFFLRKPLPCNAAAETAIHPLIWCLSILLVHVSSSPG